MGILSTAARSLRALDAEKKRNQFMGARLDRLTRIAAGNLSADRSLEVDAYRLVQNARDLARNNGYAKRFLRMARNNIAGPRGVTIRPINTFKNGKPHDRLNDAIKAAWATWSRRQYASTNGQLSWLQIQRLAVAEWFIAGEALIQLVFDRTNPFGLSLHPIDADRLDREFNQAAGLGRNEVRYGVEVDAVGRPVAYHILRSHPSERLRRFGEPYRDRVPADQIIHLYSRDDRVDLTRGVPHLAVAMRSLAHIGDAQDASLIALKVNASLNGFITTAAEAGEADDPPDEDVYLDGEPGQYKILGRGQGVVTPEPNQPDAKFPEFVKAVLKDAAVGIGTTYPFLAGDWEAANFGSMRVARQDETDEWIAYQEHFIPEVCIRVCETWLETAMLSGALAVPGYDLAQANRIAYQGRRWVSPKPLEDIEVAEREIALGVGSRSRFAAARGDELWENYEDLAEEQEYAQDLELNVEPPRKAATPQKPEAEHPLADAEMPDEMMEPEKQSAAKDRVLRLARSGA